MGTVVGGVVTIFKALLSLLQAIMTKASSVTETAVAPTIPPPSAPVISSTPVAAPKVVVAPSVPAAPLPRDDSMIKKTAENEAAALALYKQKVAAKKAGLEAKRLSMRTAASTTAPISATTAPATTVSASSVGSGENAARAAYEAKVKANRKW